MFTKTLLDEAPKDMPIIATCLGYELLNVYFGGTLIQDIHDPHKEH